MSKDIVLGNSFAIDIVDAVKNLPVIKKEDVDFLMDHKESLALTLEKTQMWRTDVQKLSIVSDFNFPTIHSKLHQTILEQKVQFDQAMYLAKDFELKKLEIEELECDLEELTDSKRDFVRRKKISLEMAFKQYELKNMQIAMDYRMQEVRGWEKIKEELLVILREQGIPEDTIWSKNDGEVTSIFFQSLNNLQGLKNSTDAAEVNNLLSLARFAVQQAKQLGVIEKLKTQCNEVQLSFLNQILTEK
jgi:hypothetical protein